MSVYSTQLAFAHPPGGSGTVYTVPTGQVTIVRDLELWQPIASGSDIYVGVQGPGLQVVILHVVAPQAATAHQWNGRAVLNSGNGLFLAGGTPETALLASGYVFSAV